MSRPLAGLVFVFIKDVDGAAWLIGRLHQLSGCQLGADCAGRVAKTSLPQHSQVEQSFDQNHAGEVADGLPGKQAPFGSRQQTVRKRSTDTAPVEVDDLVVLPAGEDHASAEGVATLVVDQTRIEQQLQRIALGSEVTPQISAGSIADTEFLDDGGILQSTVLQITGRFRMPMELKLIEGD